MGSRLLPSPSGPNYPSAEAQAAADFAQAASICAHNSVYSVEQHEFGFVHEVPLLTSTALHQYPVSHGSTTGGKFVLGAAVGSGSFATCFKAMYHASHGGAPFEVVLKISIVKSDATPVDINRIPAHIIEESTIQTKFSHIEGVVHAHHAAELHCAGSALPRVITNLFGGAVNAYQPHLGDRLFSFCLPAYNYHLGTCLAYESYYLHYRDLPPDSPNYARAPPLDKAYYLWLTMVRFYRLYNAVSQMHKQGHGHHDIKPANILVRHSRDPSAIDLADFGLASRWEEECVRSLQWNNVLKRNDDYRKLRWKEAACYVAPETVQSAVVNGAAYGIPSVIHLSANDQSACEEEFAAFDCWGLGFTLFAMLQAGFLPPVQHLGWAYWSRDAEGLPWLNSCTRFVKEKFNTSSVIETFVLSFLEELPSAYFSQKPEK